MITHYGLFWSERDIFWGHKNRRNMLGRERTPLNRRGAPTKEELRKTDDYREYKGLYCLYGTEGLVYIGEAGLTKKRTLFDRLKDHRNGSMAGRWEYFSWFGRKDAAGSSENVAAIAQLEAVAIAITNPGFNKQSGTFKDAMQVFQVPHEDAEGDLETKLDRIADKLDRLAGDN